MIYSPKEAVAKGWIKFPSWMSVKQQEKCLQPNAIDFTLDKLYSVDKSTHAVITETTRNFRDNIELPPTGGQWQLLPHQLYDGMSDFYVNVPEKVACLLIIRSSFNRVGIALGSGLYDSGFTGNIGFTLYNRSGLLFTAPNTRVGQIMFVASDSIGQYGGIYNSKEGEHWASSVGPK